MTGRSGDAFFEETWARADNTDLGGFWTTTAGDPQIVQETLKQSTSAAQTARVIATATSLAPDLGSEVAAQAVFAATSDSTAREAYILLRWDADNSWGYKVGLKWEQAASAEKLTLLIVKIDAVGTTFRETTLGSTVVTTKAYTDANGSYIDQFQNVRARIYDDSGEVTIEAKLNDEEEPLLQVTDREYPLYRAIGSFGVELEEGEASPATGYVLCDYLAIQGIGTGQDPSAVQPTYWTFGRLKEKARALALRDSSSNINDSEWGDWVNDAIQEMFLYCGQPLWGERRWTFKLKAGVTSVPLPPNARDVDSHVLDTTTNESRPIVREDVHMQSESSNATTGTPIYFRLGGDGRSLVLRPYPLAAQTQSYQLRYFSAPSHMLEDSEIPDVPDDLCHGIIWGAVVRWAYRDGSRRSDMGAEQKWMNALRMARRVERRRASRTFNHTIRSGLHTASQRLYSDYARSRYGWRGH